MFFVKTQANRGSSLIAALVSLMILGVAAKVLMQLHASSTGSVKSTGIRLDLQDIKRKVNSQLSCQKTLESFGTIAPISCSGNVTLRDRNGQNIISADGKLAGWTITARCETIGTQNGLSIYATKKLPSGQFAKDPLNPNMVLDESSPVSLLFKPDVRPCASFFDPTAATFKTCPNPDEYIAGVNFESGQLNCLPKLPPNPNLTDYVQSVTSPTQACGGSGPKGHIPATATCPAGWIAASCGYNLSSWAGGGSNAPDLSQPINPSQCQVIAGGKPGPKACFKSIANCINLNKLANGN